MGRAHKRKPSRAITVAYAGDVKRMILGKNWGYRARTPYVKSYLDEGWSSEFGCFTSRPSSPKNRPCCAD